MKKFFWAGFLCLATVHTSFPMRTLLKKIVRLSSKTCPVAAHYEGNMGLGKISCEKCIIYYTFPTENQDPCSECEPGKKLYTPYNCAIKCEAFNQAIEEEVKLQVINLLTCEDKLKEIEDFTDDSC